MKLNRLAPLVLTALSALASAQRVPGPPIVLTQVGLVADSGHSYLYDACVHRLNLATGANLGDFGKGIIMNATSVAVQPSTGVAYVADHFGIERFEVKTGKLLGWMDDDLAYDYTIQKIRFTSAGDLYAVVAPRKQPERYRVARINPNTGVVLNLSYAMVGTMDDRLSLGFRPDGTVEVVTGGAGHTVVQWFTPTLVPKAYVWSNDEFSTFRTSNDRGFRWSGDFGYQYVYAGAGDYTQPYTAQDLFNTPYKVLFAEGSAHQTYALARQDSFKPVVYRFNTNGTPYGTGSYTAKPLGGMLYVDMAVYIGLW